MKGTTVWHKMEFLHQQVDSKRAENIADLSTVCPQRVEDIGRSVRPTNIWYTPATGHRSHCQCSKSTEKETQRGSLSVMDGPPPAHKHCGVILTENRAEGRNIQRRAQSVLLCKDCFCCLCLHMLRYIAAPVSHLWANYKEIIRSVHVSYTQRTARCWLHLPAAWTFTPVGRSADLTWLACSHHLLESTSSGVHKASKAKCSLWPESLLQTTEGKIQLLWSDPTFVWSWSFHLWLRSLHLRSLDSLPSIQRVRASSAHLQHSRHSAPLCQLLSEVWAPNIQNVWGAVLWRPQDNKRPAGRCRLCLLSHPTFTSSSRMKSPADCNIQRTTCE